MGVGLQRKRRINYHLKNIIWISTVKQKMQKIKADIKVEEIRPIVHEESCL
jgi:hypothetical protein